MSRTLTRPAPKFPGLEMEVDESFWQSDHGSGDPIKSMKRLTTVGVGRQESENS